MAGRRARRRGMAVVITAPLVLVALNLGLLWYLYRLD